MKRVLIFWVAIGLYFVALDYYTPQIQQYIQEIRK